MPYDPDARRMALLHFMHQFNFSARRLAAAGGLSASAVTQFLKGHSRSLTDETYVMLADGASKELGWPVEPAFLRGERTHGLPLYVMQKIERKGASAIEEFFVPWENVSGILPLGKVGQNMTHVSVIEIADATMAPWREAGDLVLIDRNVSPPPNSHALFELEPPKASKPWPAFFAKVLSDAHYVTEGGTHYDLMQYNPQRVFRVPRADVLQVHKVVEWPEVIFGDYYKSRIQWFDARFSKRSVDCA